MLPLNPFTGVASKHAAVLHSTIGSFFLILFRLNLVKDMCLPVTWININVVEFTMTLPPSSSRGGSNHSLLADCFSLSVTKHMVDIMRSERVQEIKCTIFSYCWVNTYCSLNQVKWRWITGDPGILDIVDGATASMEKSALEGALS